MKWVFWIFLFLYVAATTLLVVGKFGWFGQERDPISAVFLVPLGLPWNLLTDKIGLVNAGVSLIAPAVNLGIIYWFWKR